MINRRTLSNGLRVVHYEDKTTQMVALNILYNVGARDEDPLHTGYAHLMEHLMFGGSVNIPDYDSQVQRAGGDNNAWTNNDITNFYITVPSKNVETAFWLESDRMLQLALTERSVEVQKQVVIEEFKQRHLNCPYGDLQHLIRGMAYKVHPYQWPTIGKCVEQIEEATLGTILDFYHRFYAPNNAILSIAGNISAEEAFALSEKWFGPIPARPIAARNLPQEEPQQHIRRQTVHRAVPSDLLVMTFHMPDRRNRDYYTCDLITDLLGNGYSSRLVQRLIHEQHLFSSIDSYIQGSMEPGLLFIVGRMAEGVDFKTGEEAVWNELRLLKKQRVGKEEFEKVCNRSESERVFNNINYLDRAMNMAMLEYVGRDKELEDELEHYRSVNTADIQRMARQLFRKPNSCILYYAKEKER